MLASGSQAMTLQEAQCHHHDEHDAAMLPTTLQIMASRFEHHSHEQGMLVAL